MEQTINQDKIALTGQRFNGGRFGRYLRLYCATYRSSLLSYYLIMVLGMLFCQVSFPLVTRFKMYSIEGSDQYFYIGLVFSCIFGCIMMMEAGRRMYNHMGSRDAKNTLMVPASEFEKACVWFLVWILGSIVIAGLTFLLADGVRAGLEAVFASEGSTVMTIWEAGFTFQDVFLYITSFISGQASFVLGGSVWYRNVWVKMIGFCFVMQTVMSTILIAIGIAAINMRNGILYVGDEMYVNGKENLTTEDFIWVYIGLGWLFAILSYLVAYYRNRQNGLNFRW